MLMARRRKASRATPWGYYLESLVSSRHYDNLTQFSDDLRTVGRGVTPQMISKYKSNTAPLWFIADSIDVLELDDAETNKYVGLWLDTLPPDERAVHQRMAALLLRGGGAEDVQVTEDRNLTEENEAGLEAARRRKAELDEDSIRERGERDTGDRAP